MVWPIPVLSTQPALLLDIRDSICAPSPRSSRVRYQYLRMDNAAVDEDIEVNVGGFAASFTPMSHTACWTDNDFTKPVAKYLPSFSSRTWCR